MAMSLDLTTLTLLKTKERHQRLAQHVPKRALDTRTQVILADFGRFFREFPDATEIHADAFRILFRQIHPSIKDEDIAVYDELLKRVYNGSVGDDIEQGLMARLMAAATAYDVAALIVKYNEGEEIDLRRELESRINEYDAVVERKIKNPQVLDAIEDMLVAEANNEGLSWRLPCLNRHIKPLQSGDFVVVAARPDKGKTTFCCSELTFMAPQVDKFFPGENRSILWFNNEGPGKRIVMRNFQAALGCTMEEMVALSNTPPDAEWNAKHGKEYKSKLRQAYADALGGRPGVLRVFDIHDMWSHEVEDIMKRYPAALVVFDMIDNIKFGGEVSNNGQRTDQLLEAMYQWARLMGVKYDCAVMANSQLSADADGLPFPTLPMLKDSKTGKQGAADIIVTIGAVNDPVLATSRYIGTTKNKRVRTGVPGSPMQEVIFRGDKARYEEISQ